MSFQATVYGVELMPMGKIVYYADNGEKFVYGDYAIMLSEFGTDYGKVLLGPKEVSIDDVDYEIRPIIRKATEEDLRIIEENETIASKARAVTVELVKKHKLPMKVLQSKYIFDRSKLVIYFSSKTRVDFRELVKDIAKEFKTRIELRQVGVRDEMKFIKGLGLCGMKSCCSYFLRDFDSITLKHAKRQQMMINTSKITGPCGRLLCCLMYEHDFYVDALENIPDEGSTIYYDGKIAKVITVNVFLSRVTLQTDDGEMVALPFSYFKEGENAGNWKIIDHGRRNDYYNGLDDVTDIEDE
ncbi:MAG: stage 0 sporulation family protein [Fervidobacterium sp.]|nr:stage 0 sporulation family protein [Fervidobacterium sp.]